MVRIITNKAIDAASISCLTSLEVEAASMVRKLIVSKFGNLQASISVSVIDSCDNYRVSDVVLGENNASFSLEGSLEISQAVIDFWRNCGQLSNLLPNNVLKIDFHFNRKQDNQSKMTHNNDSEVSSVFLPIEPVYSFDMMVLPDNTLDDINDALKVIECRDLIYNQWGFSEVEPIPKSILNFYGEPGTGKTMCAHAIAHKLKRSLLALNYAQIESKYVGDAPKNLQAAFDAAVKSEAVLFFDEADSFLGKRIQNVTQGSEQALNSLRSQMLILLEKFSGVVIFATNLVTNYDAAFESRILKHIHFERPNKDARIAIIRKMIPSKLPFKTAMLEQDYSQLAEISDGLSGREIKNAIHDTLLRKADLSIPDISFTAVDFVNGFTQKQEQLKKLKEEEQKDIKKRISRKLREKSMEAEMENNNSEQEEQETEAKEEVELSETMGSSKTEKTTEDLNSSDK